MTRRKALALVEVLVVVAILGAVAALVVYLIAGEREEARWLRCRQNLQQLAKGMATYTSEYGENRFYPWPTGRVGCGSTEDANAADFGGAEWLASLYWCREWTHVTDPSLFICPSSMDSNADGRDLGYYGCRGPGFQAGPDGKLKPDAVSYAGMAATSIGVYEDKKLGRGTPTSKSAIRDDFPPNEPMACDDTEGTINHPSGLWRRGGMNVIFFDTRVEFWPPDKVDLEHGVGKGELVHLRN